MLNRGVKDKINKKVAHVLRFWNVPVAKKLSINYCPYVDSACLFSVIVRSKYQ